MQAPAPVPLVSCVLIFFDGAAFIDEAIASVVHQAGFDDWELILVDDGSTDASSAIANAWAARDPARIRYVEHDRHENLGMSASRNLGVAIARGMYVAFLDCDDVLLGSALAHRTRVAAAYPEADLVVGGTWRWHSWTEDIADMALDLQMLLPSAPPYTVLRAPQLFSAMYGIPGGGHVPATCSVLVRRDALHAIGGLETQFRGLYEDQVLYVKAGLKLAAVIDPRPLALYRQHPGSACEVAITEGAWSRLGPSPAATRFFTWMQSYVSNETGTRSEESMIVKSNLAYNSAEDRTEAEQLDRGLRERVRDATPESVRAVVRRCRRRLFRAQPDPVPVSVLGKWSEQHLRVVTASIAGSVLVVVPTRPSGEPWASSIPRDAFSRAAQMTALRLDHVDPTSRFDHVVVLFEAADHAPMAAILSTLHKLLRRPGTLVALMPGPAHQPSGKSAADAVAEARRTFPDARISAETFGNAVTARAVALGTPANEVRGVAIDHHDEQTQVVIALHVSQSTG